jgi:hypothetical protein
MQDQEKLQISYDILSTNLTWIKNADSKATLIFTVNSAMMGVTTGLSSSAHSLTIPGFITSALLIISVISIAFAVFPRLKGKNDSAIYFGGITSVDENSYVQKITASNAADLIEDFAKQSYRNATIAKEKFKLVGIAVWSTFLSFPFWIAVIIDFAARKS